ncbi:tripartite tricarboxylate transporter TctB family protein [Cereibacter johrii]|uniref:tripartite tricarboxylate transporter TctB family protein n=1 Tax=Cereibacter johrii TaxID=445629 RepID=UPI003CF9D390
MKALPGIDRIVALICILIGAGYLAASFSITQGSFGDPLGPRIFPQILGALLILLSIVTLVQAPAAAGPATPGRALLAIAICGALVAGFILLMPLLGYPLTSFLLLAGFLVTLREPLLRAILTAAGLTLLFHAVFAMLLGTYFPETWLEGMVPWTR